MSLIPRLLPLLACIALAACSPGEPDAHVQQERIAAGEKLAASVSRATGQRCIDCHGAGGDAPIDPTYPRLAGQYPDYLAHALTQYRSGERQHALMTLQAARLSDQDILQLAAYFGSRPTQLRDLRGME